MAITGASRQHRFARARRPRHRDAHWISPVRSRDRTAHVPLPSGTRYRDESNLYRLDADHRCTRIAGGVKVSNGLAWSPDGRTMYHSDSRGGVIFRYAYDPETGSIGKRKVFVSMHAEWGRPDGGATDEEGCYWSCGISGGRITRLNPSGELIGYVEMPVTHPTMPCFGGSNGRTLYVTSLRENLSDAELARTPQAGGVFMLEPGVAGAPAAHYQG
ncbi:MAG: SMP-30/gluconolactonase/LRE family protein [Betaproteobacteria bacterium]|nr:MAG: SMP-30/gluconolactonase/LRE family protein [Betaproteobacteria bacterium]